MKNLLLLLVLIVVARLLSGFQIPIETVSKDQQLTFILQEWETLREELKQLSTVSDSAQAQHIYHSSRKHFKRIEFFLEYIFPVESKYSINGALVPKYDEYKSGGMIPPAGFQVIEACLFSDSIDTSYKKEAAAIVKLLDKKINLLVPGQLNAGRYLEMQQLELLRIVSMNLNGYDATITKENVDEAIVALEGLSDFLKTYFSTDLKRKPVLKHLGLNIRSAVDFCKNNPDYDTFDRLTFLRDFVPRIYDGLIDLHNALQLSWNTDLQAVNLQKKGAFGKESLNVDFFARYARDNGHLKEQADLGKILFFDPILSGNHDRSCASCHQPPHFFADTLAQSEALGQNGFLNRNTPTLMNMIFQKAFFWDGRAKQPEQQIDQVVHSREEMGGNLTVIAAKLRQSQKYRELFSTAFDFKSDQEISPYYISKALSEYEKTLIGMNSRFDRYLTGNNNSLTAEEKLGYNLFAGKALCGSCHFYPIFNGTVPPAFTDSEFEILGVPQTAQNKNLHNDLGRSAVTHAAFQQYAFKTPTVRNAAKTAPYMHNGVYTKLEDVMAFYIKGGGKGFGYDVPNQTLPFDSLKLTKPEQQAIIRFMESLTDKLPEVKAFDLPRFENHPEWNNRVWGGKY